MSSVCFHAFLYGEPGMPLQVGWAVRRADAHRLRLAKFDAGYDCGGVSKIYLSKPGSRGCGTLMHERQEPEE